MTRKIGLPALLAAALAAAPLSLTAAPGAPGEPPAICPADDSVAGPGLRAFLDPETGQLREPTPEEAQALSAATRARIAREIESLEAIVHPDGMVSMELKGLFDQHLVVVRAPDGSLSTRCVEAAEAPAALLAPPPARPVPARPLEER